MSTNIKKYLTMFILAYSINCIMFGQDIKILSKTVVFLLKESPAYEMKSGKEVEIWHKDISSGKFEQKFLKSFGTGFIINHNGRDYIVTAGHVAKIMDNSSEILLNTSNISSTSISFGDIQKSPIVKNARWFSHPEADISLHPIIYPKTKIDQLHISSSDIITEDKEIGLLNDIIILGFPLGLGVNKSLNPIAKLTHVASDLITINSPYFNPNLKNYLLDQALARGYSGSPIFYNEDILSGVSIGGKQLSAGKNPILIGILSSVISDQTGGKISIVVPISYLWEILKSDDFIAYENQL